MNMSDNTLQPMDEYLAKMLDNTITPKELETLQSWAVQHGHSEMLGDYERLEHLLRSLRNNDASPVAHDFLQSMEQSVVQSLAQQKALNSSVTIAPASLWSQTKVLRWGALILIASLASYGVWGDFNTKNITEKEKTSQTTKPQTIESHSARSLPQHHNVSGDMQTNSPSLAKAQSQKMVVKTPKNTIKNNAVAGAQASSTSSGLGSIQNPTSPIVAELEKTKKELEEKISTASDNELMQLYMRAGILYVESGNSKMAREHLQKALIFAQKLQSPQTEGHALGRLGMIEARANNMEKAKEYYQKAIDKLKPVGGNYERWETELQRLQQ